MTATQELPLLLLNTVLFPGGILTLRIFETRDLDMVSACLRANSGFGIVSVHESRKADKTLIGFRTVGTLARIVDFDQLEDGLLGITCRGMQRFRVVSHRLQPDLLPLGQVLWLPDDPMLPPLPSHELLVRILRDLLEHEEMAFYARFLTPDWENAAWIGNRLAEFMSLPLPTQQALLEMTEPQQRLDILLALFDEQRLV